ncbi:MAG: hypothetical protein WCC69_15160 [Pirellulales bacterium]
MRRYAPARRVRLNDRHVGATVFVIGAGPQLGLLNERHIKAMESHVTIAVNKTFYRLRPTYFLSAYIGEMMLAARRTPDATLIHMRPVKAPPLIAGIHSIRRREFQPDVGLPRHVDPLDPALDTKFNVALGATHLAYVMGAARVVFVGVEQRNLLHFWHTDPTLRELIRADVLERGDPDILRVDHPHASLANDLAALDRSPQDCMRPFFHLDHTPTFATYFDILRRAGVDVVCTTADSVVADAGARVVRLEELLCHERNAA